MRHLRHPLRAASGARRRLATYLEKRRFAAESERHFQGDARYDLERVRRGFVSRIEERDDKELLERICAAYRRSIEAQKSAVATSQATEWWRLVRESSLSPVISALETGDVGALRRMYRNFFRDPCSRGLVGVPYGISNVCPQGLKRLVERCFLADVLYRIDYWREQTGDRFHLTELAAPAVGNPFGVMFDGALVTVGGPYQHYCAQRVLDKCGEDSTVVAEIGGGFGGMAYYLLRARTGLTYLDFDVPESIALSTYYLATAIPELRFLLYGEKELTAEAIAEADVVLMPVSEMEKIPEQSVDVVFSSHALSDMSFAAMHSFLGTVGRIVSGCFFCIGGHEGMAAIAEIAGEEMGWNVVETRASGWHRDSHPLVREEECVYRVGDERQLAWTGEEGSWRVDS